MKCILSLLTLSTVAAISAVAASAEPLPRSNVVLRSAIAVDLRANTVTLPLHRGTAKGATVWYIVTDASDAGAATKLGLLYAPLIASAGDAIAPAGGTIAALKFSGTVDFSPARVLKLDANGAPAVAKPGSIGDAGYSPLVRIGSGGAIYNAPIVASGNAPQDVTKHTDTLDRVVAINTKDAARATVTLTLARGFTNGEPIAYISTDASVDGPAAIERSTYAPRLKKLVAGAIPIDVFFNGPRQGLPFAGKTGHLDSDATPANASRLGSPLNVQATFPAPGVAASGYSPLWDVFPALWTKAALTDNKADVLRSSDAVAKAAAAKLITSPDGKAFGRAGITVNCPVVAFALKRPR